MIKHDDLKTAHDNFQEASENYVELMGYVASLGIKPDDLRNFSIQATMELLSEEAPPPAVWLSGFLLGMQVAKLLPTQPDESKED